MSIWDHTTKQFRKLIKAWEKECGITSENKKSDKKVHFANEIDINGQFTGVMTVMENHSNYTTQQHNWALQVKLCQFSHYKWNVLVLSYP